MNVPGLPHPSGRSGRSGRSVTRRAHHGIHRPPSPAAPGDVSISAGPAAVARAGGPADPQTPGRSDGVARAPREVVPLYVWCLLGALVASMFSGFSGLLHLPIPPDRVLFAGAVLLLVLDHRRPRLRSQYVYWAMLAVVAWTSWSALAHGGFLAPAPAFALLDRIVVPFAMFVLGALVFTTPARRELLLVTFAGVGVYLGITAVFEIVGPHALVWPRYIMDPDVGILFGRARGPFAGAEANGMTQAMCLFMSILLFSRARGRRWVRLLALAAIACTSAGIVLALTRSVWIAVIVALVGVSLLVPAARRRLPAAIVGVVVVFGAVLALVPGVADALTERLTMESSIYDRQNTNAAGLRVVAAHPVFGVGWQQFVHVVGDWVRQDPNYPLTNVAIEVHNVFLSRAVETGLPGAFLWVLVILLGPVAVAARLRTRRPGTEMHGFALLLLAVLVVWFVPSMTSPNPYPLPNDLMWLIAGIAGRPELLLSEGSDTGAPTDAAQLTGQLDADRLEAEDAPPGSP